MCYFSYNDNPFHLSYDIGRWGVFRMDFKLIEEGTIYYNLCKEGRFNEVDSLEFRAWLATSIRSLEKVADKSELMKVTDSLKIYLQNKESINLHQLELLVGFLKAEYRIHQELVNSMKLF